MNCSLTLDKTMSERNIETFLSVRHKTLRQHISSQKLNMKKLEKEKSEKQRLTRKMFQDLKNMRKVFLPKTRRNVC